jgi:hypothetical protein
MSNIMSKIKKQATVIQSVLPTAKSHKKACSHCLQLPPLHVDDTIAHHSDDGNKSQKTQRTAHRFKTRGIVVFTIAGKPAVANVNDIATGGVSFLYADEIDINNLLTMDILIFDSQTKFEYLIPQINGQMTSRTSAAAPKCSGQCWRYGVEFIDIDRSKKTLSGKIIPPEIIFDPSVF